MEKTIYCLVISVMVILAFLIIYGKNGFMDVHHMRLQEQAIINENIAINEANRVLERKIDRLKSDISYIEHIARHELGMVAKDELVFRFQDIKKEQK
ncbi:MAG: septum formation initiator family protein [Desulfamplus sp.]|nr:septum formation initiator family protein [Desulfamplus sp.]